MELELSRISSGSESSLGYISIKQGVASYFECFTCEDERRNIKVNGRTRIPAGRYEIKLRNEGGMTRRYDRFDYHKGMLWLHNVPDFNFVYIHIGNNHEDTEGCILVGDGAHSDASLGGGSISRSAIAYERLYKKIIDAMQKESVFITIKDESVA